MKLEAILDKLNSFEKNSFLKVIENITSNNPGNQKEIEKIFSDTNTDLKSTDSNNIVKIFSLVEGEFNEYLRTEFTDASSQLDILIDILIRDGNCIMSREWLDNLYTKELKNIKAKVGAFDSLLKDGKGDVSLDRLRDYKTYKSCLHTAFWNDEINNQDCKITDDELSILITLSKQLDLSQEEVKLINYSIIPIERQEIDNIINELKNRGFIFYSRKLHTVYVADELVKILRKFRGKELADKFFRRVLRILKDPQLNLICKKHNIDTKIKRIEKIRRIISEGILFTSALQNEIFRENTNLTERKKEINNIINNRLDISPQLKGITLEKKIQNLILHFEEIEREEKISITKDGYDKLLIELNEEMPNLNILIKSEFELQDEFAMQSEYLIDYNIKPRDIIELIPRDSLSNFCQKKDIKTRGNLVMNIIEAYKDSENLFLENYENIGFRNLNLLKDNGVRIKEADLGIKFEDITKSIFAKLGFNVDEKLRKKINDKKNKIDIVLNLGNEELIIIECKTIKESGYNKFSSISRQIKSYIDLATKKEFKVIKSLLIAPDFSDDFVSDCELEYELNLSLITASSLYAILKGFKNTKHKELPYNLLMRDVLIKEDRILKAIKNK
ncbi:MAG: hypothetical protein HQ565_09890 [Bacteroidetes bacterium]|nr:hypothetical protein [Bacteroidota bacterium]